MTGTETRTGPTLAVRNKYSHEVIAEIPKSSEAEIRAAIDRAADVFAKGALAPPARYDILRRASDLVRDRADELTGLLVAETGFTVNETSVDLERTSQTLLSSAEEAKRITGEIVPLDAVPSDRKRFG